jgi:hypothetical protein
MKQNLDLSKMGLAQLSLSESIAIDGGDVDGLMQGSGPSLENFVTNVGFVVGFIKGFFS